MHYSIWHGYIYTIISLYGAVSRCIKHHFIPYTALHDVHILRILIHIVCFSCLLWTAECCVSLRGLFAPAPVSVTKTLIHQGQEIGVLE